MKTNNEKVVEMVDVVLELDAKERDGLVGYAMERIGQDEEALINWAVNDILRRYVDGMEKLNAACSSILDSLL